MAHKKLFQPRNRANVWSMAALIGVIVLFMDRYMNRTAYYSYTQSSSHLFDTPSAPSSVNYVRLKKPLPSCAKSGTRAKSFLIVFQSRSGSTAISSELRKHSETYMDLLEYLDQLNVKKQNVTGAILETRLFFEKGIKKGLVPGFKIRPNNILRSGALWRELLKEFDTRIIWQYRKNVVKSAIGHYLDEYLNDKTATGGIPLADAGKDRCKMGVGCKFKIDNIPVFYETMKRRLSFEGEIVNAVHELDPTGSCTLEVPYEDYLYEREGTMRDIQQFLGIKKEDHQPNRVKATNDSLCSVISNFDEVCNAFYGCTVWQPFFDDQINNCRCSGFGSGTTKYCETHYVKPGSTEWRASKAYKK